MPLRCQCWPGLFLPVCAWHCSWLTVHRHVLHCSVRKRHREERIASTSQKVQQMKQRLNDSERKRENWLYWRPILLNIGAGAAVAVGLLVCWIYSQWYTVGRLERDSYFAPVPGGRYFSKRSSTVMCVTEGIYFVRSKWRSARSSDSVCVFFMQDLTKICNFSGSWCQHDEFFLSLSLDECTVSREQLHFKKMCSTEKKKTRYKFVFVFLICYLTCIGGWSYLVFCFLMVQGSVKHLVVFVETEYS